MRRQQRRQTTLTVPGHSDDFSSNSLMSTPPGGRRISVALTRRLSIQLPMAPRPVERAGTIDRLSRVIFPCSFLLFNMGYWLYYMYVV
jgi:hypothetical protein